MTFDKLKITQNTLKYWKMDEPIFINNKKNVMQHYYLPLNNGYLAHFLRLRFVVGVRHFVFQVPM